MGGHVHVKWRKWPEISERHEQNRPAFTERIVFSDRSVMPVPFPT